ncbi:M2 family metallopeptidase [Sandaracinobacteroides saxicola]|uniref:M2 family metallopeptidase n=1 Tax=Sandaracinobacteroides saxicola TaxID=2759707 RepID=A0A7G5IL28_9SPHN|nr:M2 family metallopeptidase [Sandaracinobacteroides saxicola]QMW24070.1 M2 family metallopeptidase [Sandaracinobacteroides saxicola]
MRIMLSAMALLLAGASPSWAQAAPTAAEADAFVAKAEQQLLDFSIYGSRVAWVNQTYITDDTDALIAKVGAEGTEMSVALAKAAAKYDAVPGLSYDTRRKLNLLKLGLVLPAPDRPGAADELSTIATRLNSAYAKGKGTFQGKPTVGNDLEALMRTTRDPALTKEMWESWHAIGAPMKADYARMVAIANEGAKELGFADTGALWRGGYDMDPKAFSAMLDRTWLQVKPLYNALHCYTRGKLNEKYGDAVQPKTGPIRADLLGNMWAQDWSGIYDVVAPKGAGDIGYDVGDLLKAKGYDAVKMVKAGEGFYSSLGFAPLPETFWTRSMFVKPADRDVLCHASAWNIDQKDDVRIKMCIKVNGTDFVTIHHELGHNYYQRAYNKQPYLYLGSANDGFHEAIGDFVALSVTPDYLVKIGLLDTAKVPSADKDIGLLLRQAMEKVPGLPWTLLVDKWRWGVFDGSTPPADYNRTWTDLRRDYMGVVPPGPRGADAFDPGAKAHIPGNTPYARYYLARILQFQFYEAACRQAGWKGPLHRCSFYGNKDVGAKLNAMLEMGASKPWPDALQAFTGTREMDGRAVLAYFAPLQAWLDKENKGQQCRW